MTFKSLLITVLVYYCLHVRQAAGYVEAVGASIDIARGESEMQVASFCDKAGAKYHNQYMDESGRWVSDLESNKGCLKSKQEVLDYCKLIYPDFEFARAVQATSPNMISDWCRIGHRKCKDYFWVKPYKCVQADIHSSDLSVPESCKLDYIQDDSKCQASHAWSMVVNQSCKDYGMQLDSYATHHSCGHDKFTKVEFVCCPPSKKGKKSKVSGVNPDVASSFQSSIGYIEDITPSSGIDAEVSTRDPYFTRFDPRIEHDAFKAAERRLEAAHRRKITKIMKEWTDLEERYQKIKVQSPKKAEQFKLKMTQRFNKMMNALKDQGLAEKHQLVDLHQQRIIAHITERKKDGMKCFVKALNEKPASSSVVEKCLNHLLRALFKDRHHTISHFNHMMVSDPSNTQSQVAATVSHLRDIDRMVNESLQMLDRYPAIRSEVLPEMTQLVTELRGRDAVPVQLAAANESREEDDEELSPVPDAWTDDVTANRIDIDVEVERRPSALSAQHVQARPSHSEAHQHSLAEAGFRVQEEGGREPTGGRGAYITLALLSLALTVALVAGVVARRRRRRTPRHAGFIEVDQAVTPEEKHLAHMQVNGYENPTYRYFESK